MRKGEAEEEEGQPSLRSAPTPAPVAPETDTLPYRGYKPNAAGSRSPISAQVNPPPPLLPHPLRAGLGQLTLCEPPTGCPTKVLPSILV
ncbi:hypothetical protein LX36DRAFT_319648 [Colletotrichum falcatum]|nr:hypothetical protein LX36DRAFT_319648 [Colletotrichum falcatum]